MGTMDAIPDGKGGWIIPEYKPGMTIYSRRPARQLMREPYKYENAANVGDRIRSYDFQGRQDCYVEGRVIRKDTTGETNPQGFACFVITVDVDGWPDRSKGEAIVKDGCEIIRLDEHTAVIRDTKGGRVGHTTYVPLECAWMEYDGRIVNLSR